jgi:hypothetical protein
MTSAFWMSLCLCLLLGPLVVRGADTGQVTNTTGVDTPTVLGWRDFFTLPIGPRGLEPTDKLLSLRNQRVRVQGYMAREEEPVPGLFMLTPMPVTMAELADGPADYLPATTLFVHLTGAYAQQMLGYRPGIWTLTGLLRLGVQHEPNGRVSYVRLILDDLLSVRPPDHRPPTFLTEGPLKHGHHH